MTNDIREVTKLRKLESYDGLIWSIIGEDKLINKDKLRSQMLESLKCSSAAPISVCSEDGEWLDATELFMQCTIEAIHRKREQEGYHADS